MAKKKKAGPASLSTQVANKTGKNINGIIRFNKVKYETEPYRLLLSIYDFKHAVGRYEWENLPNGYKGWDIERMLYFRGSLVGFEVSKKKYILPYAIQGNLNPRGLPVKVKPVTFTGVAIGKDKDTYFFDKDFTLETDSYGDENPKANSFLLYDTVPLFTSGNITPLVLQNQPIINDQADLLKRIKINVKISSKKIHFIVQDADQADVIEQELNALFDSDSPYSIIVDKYQTQSIQEPSDYNAYELFTVLREYQSIKLMNMGIPTASFGHYKKERTNSGELLGVEAQVDIIKDLGLMMRKEWAENMNKAFNLNIKVRSKFDEMDSEKNGNNQTAKEEINSGVARNE